MTIVLEYPALSAIRKRLQDGIAPTQADIESQRSGE